ncbi:hypothetical protein [Enterococcus hirae]|uniref:hypothetical protein n=1 Tax=Enterococcus hirae TaxID=1354 RepID=UPI003846259A
MKKVLFGFAVLVGSFLLLGACGNNNKEANTSAKSSESSSVVSSTVETSSTESVAETSSSVNKENLDQAAKQLDGIFNTNDEKNVKVEVRNDVADDTSDEAHSVIEVRIIDDESRKTLEEIQDAVNSNSATDEQKTIIYGIQVNVEEVAKTLENENDTITFIVPSTNGNRMAIALANKNENIIPLVM